MRPQNFVSGNKCPNCAMMDAEDAEDAVELIDRLAEQNA